METWVVQGSARSRIDIEELTLVNTNPGVRQTEHYITKWLRLSPFLCKLQSRKLFASKGA